MSTKHPHQVFPGAGIVPSRRHPLIAIEGIDGSGKSTQTAVLAQMLPNAKVTKFPNYESPTGKLILHHLKTGGNFELSKQENAVDLQSLMTINRFEMLETIKKGLEDGPVILDRYFASGLVYGLYDGLEPYWLAEIHKTLPAPDLYVLLNVTVDNSFRRRPNRDDVYEADKKRLAFVRAAYIDFWANPWHNVPSVHGTPCRYLHLDGASPPHVITNIVLGAIEDVQKELNHATAAYL